jgi:hypothetical protein
LIESAAVLGKLPQVDLITVSVAEFQTMSLDLSAPVAAALPLVEAQVRQLLDGQGQLRSMNDAEKPSRVSLRD